MFNGLSTYHDSPYVEFHRYFTSILSFVKESLLWMEPVWKKFSSFIIPKIWKWYTPWYICILYIYLDVLYSTIVYITRDLYTNILYKYSYQPIPLASKRYIFSLLFVIHNPTSVSMKWLNNIIHIKKKPKVFMVFSI